MALSLTSVLGCRPWPSAASDFDDPGQKRQSVPGNGVAKADAMARAAAIIERTIKGR